MPRPWLGEIAYEAYCAALGVVPQWEELPCTQRLAWGTSVLAGITAALDLPLLLAQTPRPYQQAYILYRLERRSPAEVCATLKISRRTLYRYVAQQERAVQAA